MLLNMKDFIVNGFQTAAAQASFMHRAVGNSNTPAICHTATKTFHTGPGATIIMVFWPCLVHAHNNTLLPLPRPADTLLTLVLVLLPSVLALPQRMLLAT